MAWICNCCNRARETVGACVCGCPEFRLEGAEAEQCRAEAKKRPKAKKRKEARPCPKPIESKTPATQLTMRW